MHHQTYGTTDRHQRQHTRLRDIYSVTGVRYSATNAETDYCSNPLTYCQHKLSVQYIHVVQFLSTLFRRPHFIEHRCVNTPELIGPWHTAQIALSKQPN
jgi:hypothetical protein